MPFDFAGTVIVIVVIGIQFAILEIALYIAFCNVQRELEDLRKQLERP